MNLDRIHFKVQNDSLLILNQISELKKLNLLVRFDASLYSEQTINTGGKIRALNLKSVEQFKGLKPFNVLSETQLLDLYQIGVLENLDKYNFKINVSDLVSYNNRNFIVLGVVVNTYAQWNLPTPLLFNPNAMSNDVKSLYGSRLTEVQIVERINDNFQKGKYDNDIVIPLVDMAKPKDIISVVKPFITEKDTLDVFSKILKLKNADFEIKKDVFINTIADLKAEEIVSLKSRDEDLYNSFNLFTKSLNDIINKKIADLPASEKPKPARKPRAKKEVVPVVEKDLLTDLSNTKIWIGDNPELSKKVQEKAFELGWQWLSGKKPKYLESNSLTFDDDKIMSYSNEDRSWFNNQSEREIFESDLFGKEIPKDKFDVISIEYFDQKFKNTFDLYKYFKDILIKREAKGSFELSNLVEYSDNGILLRKTIYILVTNVEPKGYEFNFETMSSADFLEMLNIQFPEFDWDGFNQKDLPKTTSVEPKTEKGELPDNFDVIRTLVKDLPKGLFELTMFEAIKQDRKYGETKNQKLFQAIDWGRTKDGGDFWVKINDGDLTEFKEKYGKKGELAIKMYEDYMKKVASAKEDTEIEIPEKLSEEVKAVELLVYPPKGKVITIRTESLYELHDISRFVLSKFKMKTMRFNFNAITDLASYTTQISFNENDSQDDFIKNLSKQYDTFVKPKLIWKNFDETQGDIDLIELNVKKVNSAFEVEVEKPKVVEVNKYTAIAFEGKSIKNTLSDTTFSDAIELFVKENEKKGYEVYVDLYEKGKLTTQVYKTKKPVAVAKSKPIEKAKPIKTIKPKITKPKEKDDLSFLDDLDNIF